jgi:hypothetical protein
MSSCWPRERFARYARAVLDEWLARTNTAGERRPFRPPAPEETLEGDIYRACEAPHGVGRLPVRAYCFIEEFVFSVSHDGPGEMQRSKGDVRLRRLVLQLEEGLELTDPTEPIEPLPGGRVVF